METLTRPILEWYAASETLPSEVETGDRGHVSIVGRTAFALAIDALGHGNEAAKVADRAKDFLLQQVPEVRLESIFEYCHQHLRGTRGVALCLATIDAGTNTLFWLSVGNIQAVHLKVDRTGIPHYESLIMRGGVVGDRLPELRASSTELHPGDMLVMATDGVGYGWHSEYRRNISARELACAMLERHCSGNDDALALAIRYNGLDGVEA